MKTAILFIVISLTSLNCLAQQDTSRTINAKNAVFIELLGSSLLYSVNYERALSRSFVLRGGFGYIKGGGFVFNEGWLIPVSASYLRPLDTNAYVELGFANTIITLKEDSDFLFGPIIGLRKQNFMEGGSYGRITFTPLIKAGKKFKFIPWAGISFGAGF